MYARLLLDVLRLGLSGHVSLADSALLMLSIDELEELCLDRCISRVRLLSLLPIEITLPSLDSVTELCSPVARSTWRSLSPTALVRSQSLPSTEEVCPLDRLREHSVCLSSSLGSICSL